jgi:hypothetical protein
MLTPYNDLDDSAESVTSTSSADSGADTDHSGETDGTSVSDRLKQDGRLQAVDQWRTQALSWINGPGRAPVVEGPGGAGPSSLSLQNTAFQITEQRVVHTLMVDSLDRDQRVYPLPTQFRIRLPRTYRNVARIDIVQIKMLSGLYAFSAEKGNTLPFIADMSGNFLPLADPLALSLADGTYSMQDVLDFINLPAGFSIDYSVNTGRVVITGPTPFQILPPPSIQPLPPSDWGLGWNLGFGGLPAPVVAYPCSAGYCATASCFPRLTTDYIFLRMSETEFMNSVDHTDVEDTAVSQDPTGQVSHYFAKLLLNDFGCYAQTMIESPKVFTPVLGRLDRLSFTWMDRWGRPLGGPDAASCDWHMTLRITEIQDRAPQSSTLVRAGGPQ